MLSEKLAKYSLIRDDKFIDVEKNRKKLFFFFANYFLQRRLFSSGGAVWAPPYPTCTVRSVGGIIFFKFVFEI